MDHRWFGEAVRFTSSQWSIRIPQFCWLEEEDAKRSVGNQGLEAAIWCRDCNMTPWHMFVYAIYALLCGYEYTIVSLPLSVYIKHTIIYIENILAQRDPYCNCLWKAPFQILTIPFLPRQSNPSWDLGNLKLSQLRFDGLFCPSLVSSWFPYGFYAMVQYFKSHISKKSQTTTWDVKNTVKHGINYKPQLVSFPGFLPSVNCFSPPMLRS